MSTPTPVPSTTTITAAQVAVVSKTQASNGKIDVLLRPNGDPSGDYSCSIYVTAKTAPADVQAWLAQEKQVCADLYNAMQNTHSTLLAAIA